MNFKKPTLIAEVGCNHKGEIEIAKQFIKVAKEFCDVPCIKFQKRDPDCAVCFIFIHSGGRPVMKK